MQLKFLACITEIFHCAYSPYALNELNHALTQQILAQHEKNKILSFYPKYDGRSEKTISSYCPSKECTLLYTLTNSLSHPTHSLPFPPSVS
jgi:hypothetical protein